MQRFPHQFSQQIDPVAQSEFESQPLAQVSKPPDCLEGHPAGFGFDSGLNIVEGVAVAGAVNFTAQAASHSANVLKRFAFPPQPPHVNL